MQAAMLAAYVRHAKNPDRLGADTAHLKGWAQLYEARASLAEQNPAFAQTLLPATATGATTPPNSLPLAPAGVRWAVDQDGANTITLTVDVAGVVAMIVQPPSGLTPFSPPLTLAPTRATTTFAAPTDGLYFVTLTVGGHPIAKLYVPVTRAAFRQFREDSRYLGFAFRPSVPRPDATYLGRLARLIGAEALARTGQSVAALAAIASATALGSPDDLLYPYPQPC